jgi:probable F420-dependent oxidoreductase
MNFGIVGVNTGPFASGDGARQLARAAEEAGFESLWAVEHVVVPAGYRSTYPYHPSGKIPGGRDDPPIPDPLIWLSHVAAVTQRIRLGTGILILPQRNPLVTAKAVATLDAMSGGRVLLGVGVGWLEEEFVALGVPFERRGARTDDYIRALRTLWTQDLPSYTGEFVAFRDAYCRPQPAQGSVPIIIGGHSERAARRAGALGDGFYPFGRPVVELVRLFQIARESARAHGRDPDALELTAGPVRNRDEARRLAEVGASRLAVYPMPPERLARFADEVIAKLS